MRAHDEVAPFAHGTLRLEPIAAYAPVPQAIPIDERIWVPVEERPLLLAASRGYWSTTYSMPSTTTLIVSA